MEVIFTIEVGFTYQRPVVPDQRTHTIVLAWPEDDPAGASLFAAQWICSRPGVVMATRTTIVNAVL